MTFAIRGRRGTAAQWTTANPILGLGEFGYETDTRSLKAGDGVTHWTSLLYLAVAGGGGTVTAAGITDSTATGRSVITAASQTAARTAIGAVGTSLTINGHPLSANVTIAAGDIAGIDAAITAATQPLGMMTSVREVTGAYPNRPASTAPVVFIGADIPVQGGTTAGGTAKAVNGLDFWWKTA